MVSWPHHDYWCIRTVCRHLLNWLVSHRHICSEKKVIRINICSRLNSFYFLLVPCLIGKQFIVAFGMFTIMVSSWGQTEESLKVLEGGFSCNKWLHRLHGGNNQFAKQKNILLCNICRYTVWCHTVWCRFSGPGNPLGKYLQFEGLKVCCADEVCFWLDEDWDAG